MRALAFAGALLMGGLALALPPVHAEAPEEYSCVFPDHGAYRPVREVECPTGTQVWQYVWYYPPLVYEVWCFLTHDCPCPHCPGSIPPVAPS
jgi:hypothetical protein